MTTDLSLYEIIKKSSVNLILSVPCVMLKGLLAIIDEKCEIPHIPVTREEEGVGIAAGAYLSGKLPALVMQNSGLGNSINAIKSLLELYEIPLAFIMSHRGGLGEKILAQIPMGKITPKLLDCIGIKKYYVKSPKDFQKFTNAMEYYREKKKSVAILLAKSLWEEN
jgi:sulfopyruvate decarboxylase subunit alpha